jgi:hypothetical protein
VTARLAQLFEAKFPFATELFWMIVRILYLVLLLLAAGAFIYIVGGIPLRGTAITIVLLVIGWKWSTDNVVNAVNVHASCFTPCSVWIMPNIRMMLVDLGLVTDEQEWPCRPPVHPWTPLHTLYYGIEAVVLSTESGPWQVHWTGSNRYTTNLEYFLRLEFLKLPHPVLRDKNADSDWSPEFFFRSGLGGYHIGIRVLNDWWIANKDRLEKTGIVKSVNDCNEADGGRVRITLAMLPDKVLWLFYFYRWPKKSRQKLIKKIKEELPFAGWKIKAPWSSWGKSEEISIDGVAHYVGEYAEVSLGHLSRGLTTWIGAVPDL